MRTVKEKHQSYLERRTEYYAIPTDPAVGFTVGAHPSIAKVEEELGSHEGMVGEWTIVTKVKKVIVS